MYRTRNYATPALPVLDVPSRRRKASVVVCRCWAHRALDSSASKPNDLLTAASAGRFTALNGREQVCLVSRRIHFKIRVMRLTPQAFGRIRADETQAFRLVRQTID